MDGLEVRVSYGWVVGQAKVWMSWGTALLYSTAWWWSEGNRVRESGGTSLVTA